MNGVMFWNEFHRDADDTELGTFKVVFSIHQPKTRIYYLREHEMSEAQRHHQSTLHRSKDHITLIDVIQDK